MYDRIMCFVNCHFAAHLEAVNRRNADFDHIYRNMVFSRSSSLLSNASGVLPYLFFFILSTVLSNVGLDVLIILLVDIDCVSCSWCLVSLSRTSQYKRMHTLIINQA